MTVNTIGYYTEIENWRLAIETTLRRDWVSLVGRFELKPGVNRIGTDPADEIVLPAGSAPNHVGDLQFEDGAVTLTIAPGAVVFVNGVPQEGTIPLRSDAIGTADMITVNALTFFIIQRGPRTIVRVRDANSPVVQSFSGRHWFPVDDSYCIEGMFTPYDPPKPLAISNMLGDTSAETSPGEVTFTLGDQEHRLDATGWRDGGLVLHFRDTTNGRLTYNGGRSLTTAPPVGNLVLLDFNRTVNLPCAFTAFATCPLPPQQNTLSISVEAGEMRPDQASGDSQALVD